MGSTRPDRVRCTSARTDVHLEDPMEFLLWLIAVALVISGIVSIFRKQIAWGVVLIIVGLLVGPGGVSIFS